MVAGIYGSLAQLVEHWTFNPGVLGFESRVTHFFMREWLSGRASPCQGEGREFESRLALFISGEGKKEASNIELLQFVRTVQKAFLRG